MKNFKRLKWAGISTGVLIVALAGAQVVGPPQANLSADTSHTIRAQFDSSQTGLVAVLDRACGECHSNSLSSRWYTKVAPFSFLIARGADEGRKAVNFAEWSTYSAELQNALLLASCSDAKNGKMPVSVYLRFRPDAELSARDIETICAATP